MLQSNSLLGVECLFRFTSKEIKDSIINNYEDIGGNRTAVRGQKEELYDENIERNLKNAAKEKERNQRELENEINTSLLNKGDIWT